jgi:hypothetical protein
MTLYPINYKRERALQVPLYPLPGGMVAVGMDSEVNFVSVR